MGSGAELFDRPTHIENGTAREWILSWLEPSEYGLESKLDSLWRVHQQITLHSVIDVTDCPVALGPPSSGTYLGASSEKSHKMDSPNHRTPGRPRKDYRLHPSWGEFIDIEIMKLSRDERDSIKNRAGFGKNTVTEFIDDVRSRRFVSKYLFMRIVTAYKLNTYLPEIPSQEGPKLENKASSDAKMETLRILAAELKLLISPCRGEDMTEAIADEGNGDLDMLASLLKLIRIGVPPTKRTG